RSGSYAPPDDLPARAGPGDLGVDGKGRALGDRLVDLYGLVAEMRRNRRGYLGHMMIGGAAAHRQHDFVLAYRDVEIGIFPCEEMAPVPHHFIEVAFLEVPPQVGIDVLADPGENLVQHLDAIARDDEVDGRVHRAMEIEVDITLLLVAQGLFRRLLHGRA